MQYCRIISLDNNNSVKFTREDNSTTNDSMAMKTAHAQLHMYTNITYKFQSYTCKTVGEKLWTKLCTWTDGRTAMAIPVYPPPLHCGGYKDLKSRIWTNGDKIIFLSRKHCGKRRNCLLQAISPFSTMF